MAVLFHKTNSNALHRYISLRVCTRFIAWICLTNAVFFVSSSHRLAAQDYGVIGGLTFSDVSSLQGLNVRPGVQFGGYVHYGDDEVLFFKAEALIAQRGTLSWSDRNKERINAFYLDVPILLSLRLNRKIALHGGIQPGMLLRGVYRFTENGSEEVLSAGSAFRRFDYSYLLGAEYKMREQMRIGLRYGIGFVPLQSYDSRMYINGKLPTMRTLHLYYAYKLAK